MVGRYGKSANFKPPIYLGGGQIDVGGVQTRTNTGGIYNMATGNWTPTTTTGAPSARNWHRTEQAIWTGDTGNPLTSHKFFLWGGDGANSRQGWLYDPVLDSWTATALSPAGSLGGFADNFQMVWTGDTGNAATAFRVFISGSFGGSSTFCYLYNAATDAWTTTPAMPSARYHQSAIWTGETGNPATSHRIILWGGFQLTNAGMIYDVANNTWTSASTIGAPSARYWNAAVWTGDTGNPATSHKMIIWGGYNNSVGLGGGGIYDPATNTWAPMSSTNEPTARWNTVHHWDSVRKKMLIWAGGGGVGANGKWYDPATDSWSEVSELGNPILRRYISSIFTGSYFILWGGEGGNPYTTYRNEGALFRPQ